MLKLFLGRNVLLQLAIVFVLSVVLILSQYGNEIVVSQGFAPLYDMLYDVLVPFPIITQIITIVLFLMLIIGVPLIMQFYDLSSRLSYIGSLFMVMLCLAFPSVVAFSPILISSVLFLFIIKQVFDLEESVHKEKSLFGVAFFSGISSLIFLPSSLLFILLLLALIYMQIFTVRHVIFLFLHFILPYFLIFVWTFYLGIHTEFFDSYVSMFSIRSFSNGIHISWLDNLRWVGLAFILVLTVLRHLGILMSQLIQIRRYSMLVLWALLLSVFCIFWVPNTQEYLLLALFVPLSMLLSFVLKDIKKFKVYNIIILVILSLELFYLISIELHVIT